MPSNGWDEYKRLVMDSLGRLERLQEAHDEKDESRFAELHETLAAIRQDIAGLKVRSGLWGAVAGAIPALVILVLVYLESRA